MLETISGFAHPAATVRPAPPSRCPDCSAECAGSGLLVHAESCPLPVRRRAMAAKDAEWLARRPEAVARIRTMTPTERDEARALGLHLHPSRRWRAAVRCPTTRAR